MQAKLLQNYGNTKTIDSLLMVFDTINLMERFSKRPIKSNEIISFLRIDYNLIHKNTKMDIFVIENWPNGILNFLGFFLKFWVILIRIFFLRVSSNTLL